MICFYIHASITDAAPGKYTNFKKRVDMKKGSIFFVVGIALFFTGCGKKKPVQDADFWYKKTLQELQLEAPGEVGWRKALGSLDHALVLDAKKADYWSLKGSLLLLLDMPMLSIDAFNVALKNASTPTKRAEVLNNYACSLSQLGREEEAFASWQAALNTSSYQTPEVVYCNQGQHWLRKQDYEKALAAFNKAVSLATEYSDAHFYKALSLFYLKRYGQAHDALVTLLALDPEYQPAHELKKQLVPFLASPV
jgi:tetratricopeptide (TPR) repeat protein